MLLDLNLPKLDGLEVLEAIKGDPALRHTPVIMLTTSSSSRDVLACYERGANCYVVKPLDLDEFTRARPGDQPVLARRRRAAAGVTPGSAALYPPGMAEVAMPRLSDSMEEGTILKWLKSDGDEVSRGDELVEIETDKANMTYEADLEGVLKIVAQEGDTLPVGQTIAQIGGDGGGGGESEASEEPQQQAADEEVERVKQPEPVATEEKEEEPERESDENGRVKASPIARRMAKELGVELASLRGSGPGGRIVKSDVEAAAKDGEEPAEEEKPREAPAPVASGDTGSGRGATTTEDLSRLQQTIARRMAESKATAPDFVITCEVDMDAAVEFRKQLKAAAGEDGVAPSFNDFVVKASALALKEFPRANGAYRDGKFELYSRVNVGIAVAGQDALIVPTVFDADTQVARPDRARRPRAGRARPRRQDHAAGALLRHVQRLQPRHVRDQALHGGDQPAAGGDPRGRRDDAAAGRARRRDHGAARSWSSRSAATTGSSTAPTPRSSSAASASGSRTPVARPLATPVSPAACPACGQTPSDDRRAVRLHRSSRTTRAGRVSVSTIRQSERRGSSPGTQAR